MFSDRHTRDPWANRGLSAAGRMQLLRDLLLPEHQTPSRSLGLSASAPCGKSCFMSREFASIFMGRSSKWPLHQPETQTCKLFLRRMFSSQLFTKCLIVHEYCHWPNQTMSVSVCIGSRKSFPCNHTVQAGGDGYPECRTHAAVQHQRSYR